MNLQTLRRGSGSTKPAAGRGIAIFDYDNDGYLDIAIAAAHGGVQSLPQQRRRHFHRCLDRLRARQIASTRSASLAGDYNNDGFVDLYITRLGFYGGEGELLRNNGDGTFTNVTEEAGLKLLGPGVHRFLGRLRWRRLPRSVHRQ